MESGTMAAETVTRSPA